MNQHEFELLFEDTVTKCREVLINKAKEYASDTDRMHNFKKAAHFNGHTPEQELWSFLTKHLVSITDMVQSGQYYQAAVWDEKVGDALNYLFLLRALVVENEPIEEQMELFETLETKQAPMNKKPESHITINNYAEATDLQLPRDAGLSVSPHRIG